jgi:L-lactate dehydrogenase complex protein LldG
MSARDDILASIRRALAGAETATVAVPSDYRSRRGPADVAALFAGRVADYRAVVERCSSREVADRIGAALGPAARVLVPVGLPWPVPGQTAAADLTATELDEYDAVVTGSTLGIAETGTIVLTHGPGEGRRALTLVPDLHICVVRVGDLVADVPAAVRLLDPGRPQTWISGPSATSDIELSRVEGVHGPRSLHVILVD